ncbi:MAG TPA: maltose alpha-D-glucosyltransferase [Candidatus Limnocylindrales bacterium]|nr:maltose alpha-D-glucosyltransferase [Candidatus Limnocylindrales bacterium]
MRPKRALQAVLPGPDPLWYKDAIIYELHVRAFSDSNGDGIGDFPGLMSKLDYLQDLGVTALWLLPFYPSPLRDDGYDIADYTNVHPSYGTLGDFKKFLNAAHDRGLRVITELAINHTSSDHPWFQRARRSPAGSRARDYYVWSDTPDKYRGVRIIFEDFEHSNWSWDPVARAYYWHRFYSHQPDLNFDSPDVQKAVLRVLDFWMELGVDGLRLDAIPYLFEREGTNCENLPETHQFLKRLRAHVDARYQDRMLLAEANMWPDDAAAYFGDGDECHMNFHFPVMPRLFMSVQLESRYPIVDILKQTPQIPENCQWALFLRNHDELTLEMVTDEDRDYMYRTYAEDPTMRVNLGIRRRLAPLLRLRSKIELMSSLLMSLPGTPVMYYGDELGQGDNVYLGDRNGVRTPMQWSADRNAGFSRASSQRLYLPVISDAEYHYEAVNVDAQQANPESLLWWTKRLIAMRKQHAVFGRGTIEFLDPDNHKVLCFIRSLGDDQMLVVANLSRHAQYVELDLSRYKGQVPIETMGGTEFPPIGDLPYLLTLGGYGFLWFELESPHETAAAPSMTDLPRVEAKSEDALLQGRLSKALDQTLRSHIQKRRWYRSKTRRMKSLRIIDRLPLPSTNARKLALAVVLIEYESDLPEHYVMPLGLAEDGHIDAMMEHTPEACIAHVCLPARNGWRDFLLYDATGSDELATSLLQMLTRKRSISGEGELTLELERDLRTRLARGTEGLHASSGSLEQSNTTLFYGQEVVLKIYRQLQGGMNPDAEVGRFLTRRGFANTPPVLGTIEYEGPGLSGATVGLVQKYVGNQGNAWDMTLEALSRSLEHALSLRHAQASVMPPLEWPLARDEAPPEAVGDMIGSYNEMARRLGQRTAELHAALASDPDDPEFAPEPFAGHYQRSILQAAQDRLARSLQLLKKSMPTLIESARPLAEQVLANSDGIAKALAQTARIKVDTMRIRIHGDLHLGQVLHDGRDFIFIDFEGEPAVSLTVRRLKRSALIDVSGMLRSFHYAATKAYIDPHVRAEDRPLLRPWIDAWCGWVSAAFLGAYMETAGDAPFLPPTAEGRAALIQLHLIEKCAYELAYELNNRPDWVAVPLVGLLEIGARS